jgi:hypothetical protein
MLLASAYGPTNGNFNEDRAGSVEKKIIFFRTIVTARLGPTQQLSYRDFIMGTTRQNSEI